MSKYFKATPTPYKHTRSRSLSPSPNDSDFATALQRYNEAISLDPHNFNLYCNRSSANLSAGRTQEAIQDARKAVSLQPDHSLPFYRLGVAMKRMQNTNDAIVAFCQAVSRDAKDHKSMDELLELVLSGGFGDFTERYRALSSMGMAKDSFIILSSIGNELMKLKENKKALSVLESARLITTDKFRVKSKLLFSLADLYWGAKDFKRAIQVLEENLTVCDVIQDKEVEVRCCSNLAQCFQVLKQWNRAVEIYVRQINTALSVNDLRTAVLALSSMGQCYTHMEQYTLAVPIHRRAVFYARHLEDKLSEAKEHCNAGCALISAGRPQHALFHLQEYLQLSRELGEVEEEKHALANLSQGYLMVGGYQESFSFSKSLLTLSTQGLDHTMTTRAYAGMGKARQAVGEYEESVQLFTEQLKYSKEIQDPAPRAKALANLAYAYEVSGNNSMSLKYGYDLLSSSQTFGLTSLQAKAYGVLGKNYSSLGNFSEALKYYQLQMRLQHTVRNPNIRLSTLCELASCYADMGETAQAYERFEDAVKYAENENCSRDMLCHALEHYGRFLCKDGKYRQALVRLERCLEMTAASRDSRVVRRRICRELAVCYESLGDLEHSIPFYQEMLRHGKELGDRNIMLESLERLQAIYRALGDVAQAAVYEDKRHTVEMETLSIASSSPYRSVSIAELAKRGDELVEKGNLQEAALCFEDLLEKARVEEQPLLEGVANVGLARVCQKREEYQEAIYHLKNDVLIRRTMHDLTGEVASLERLGDLCFEGEMYNEALSHFENQLEVARQANSLMGEVRGLGKLGDVLSKLGRYQDAMGYYNDQLLIYNNNVSVGQVQDQAECCANIGDIQLRLHNLPEALSCHTQHLALVQQLGQPRLQIRAYGSIGRVHLLLGQHDDALMCYDKKQRLSRQLESQSSEVQVYGEMASVYIATGDWGRAVSCFRHQRDLALQMLEEDHACVEAKRSLYLALSGLADVYFQQGIYNKALENECKGFEVANQLGEEEWKMRANGSLADIHEKIHNFRESISYRETQLQLARNLRDSSNIAYSLLGLGRCQFYRGDLVDAAASLREAVTESCSLSDQVLEGRSRYYLGLVHLHLEEMETAETVLQTARPLIEGLISDSFLAPIKLVELLHMQENLFLGLELSLAALSRPLEALVVADCKKHTRLLKYIVHRYNTSPEVLKSAGFFQLPLLTYDISKLVKRISHTVVVYSMAYDKLHVWVLREGLVRFEQIDLTEAAPTQRRLHFSSLTSLSGEFFLFTDCFPGLAELISQVRDSIGVSTLFASRKMPLSPVLPFTPLSKASDSETGSVSRSSVSSGSSKRSATPGIDYQASTEVLLARLYSLLIEPIEKCLPSPIAHQSVTFILDRDLHLIPFPLLSPRDVTLPSLARSHKLLFSLSLQSLLQQFAFIPHCRSNRESRHWTTIHSASKTNDASNFLILRNITRDLDLPEEYSVMLAQPPTAPLVVASPHLMGMDTSSNDRVWCMKPAAEKEARRVGGILKVKPILRNMGSRDRVMKQLETTNCVFYSGQISWETMELIFLGESHAKPSIAAIDESATIERLSLEERGRGDGGCDRGEGDGEEEREEDTNEYTTINSEDILLSNLEKMNLFVLSGHCLTSDSELDINDIISLAHIMQSAGVKSLLLPLWASPDNAARTFLMSLFNGLSKGGRLIPTLQKTIEGIQGFSSFSHPLNWAHYMVLGSDVALQELSPAPYFRQLISNPPEETRNILNFLKELLVEAESLLAAGCSEPNVIPQKDVAEQVGTCVGWKHVLHCAGFSFNTSILSESPNCIVYPCSDHSHTLHTCISYVSSFLEMDKYMLCYLQNLSDREILIYPLLRVFKLSLFQLPTSSGAPGCATSEYINVGTEIYAWNAPDCQEMLKYIGYRVKSVSATDVQLKIPKHHLSQSYLKSLISCLHALFGAEELLPRIVLGSLIKEETL